MAYYVCLKVLMLKFISNLHTLLLTFIQPLFKSFAAVCTSRATEKMDVVISEKLIGV